MNEIIHSIESRAERGEISREQLAKMGEKLNTPEKGIILGIQHFPAMAERLLAQGSSGGTDINERGILPHPDGKEILITQGSSGGGPIQERKVNAGVVAANDDRFQQAA